MISFSSEQRILVTGASSGIGAAIALQCSALGATVIANGRSCEKLEAVRAQSAAPERFYIEPRDLLEDMESLPLWVKELREKYGKFRGLVPCAGEYLVMSLREYDLGIVKRHFDLSYHVPLLLSKGFADRRNNMGAGAAIVFISSLAGATRERGLSFYGAAKAALATASNVLSKELAAQGIRVNALAPAMVQSPLLEAWFDFLGAEAAEKERLAYPLGLGLPSDVSNMAAYLLSDAARWITGQVIAMDGGRY